MAIALLILASSVAAVALCAAPQAQAQAPAPVTVNFYEAGGAGMSGGVQQGDSLVDRLGINDEAFFSSHVVVDEPPPAAAPGGPKPGVELVAGQDGNLAFEGDQGLADRVQDLADKQGASFGTLNFYQAGGPGVDGAEQGLGDRVKPPSPSSPSEDPEDSVDRDSHVFDWDHAGGLQWSWQFQ